MAKSLDVSYPKEAAERRLGVKPNSLSLDELAERLSIENTEDPVSVRDHTVRPVPHSKVFFRGVEQSSRPHLAKYS